MPGKTGRVSNKYSKIGICNRHTIVNAIIFSDEPFESIQGNGSGQFIPQNDISNQSGVFPLGIRFIVRQNDPNYDSFMKRMQDLDSSVIKKSENFEVINNHDINFNDVGGYENVKVELLQSADILVNYTKYQPFNVRVPKGVILEGPPMVRPACKRFSGEVNTLTYLVVSFKKICRCWIS